jgi:hypothetical protein
MLEENNLSTIESIKKEYNLTQNELEKKHQVNKIDSEFIFCLLKDSKSSICRMK